ncbi:MAG: biopolymer transport protein [Bacteroidetes bacterium]|jgi:biopolymer transport protein ExbD|nr:biopolymer transport protein [Bacteroidota bacterium]
MAEIIASEGGGKKKGKKRAKKFSTAIDMTPMVDVMCLLLTFFMLTTAFSKPKIMEIVLPEKTNEPSKTEIPKWRAVNIILDENDRIFYYNGLADPTKPPIPTVIETDFSKDGIRKMLLERNKVLFKQISDLNNDVLTGKQVMSKDTLDQRLRNLRTYDDVGPIVLIKATEKVKYKNIVDIIDEMAICNIARYSLTEMNSFEEKLLAKAKRDIAAGQTGQPN